MGSIWLLPSRSFQIIILRIWRVRHPHNDASSDPKMELHRIECENVKSGICDCFIVSESYLRTEQMGPSYAKDENSLR